MNGLIRGIAYCFLLLPNLLVVSVAHAVVGFGPWGNVSAFCLYAVVLFLVVLVHEAGHATAALIFGWRVTLFAVFPFAYRAKTGRWSFWVAPSGDLGGAVAVSSKGSIRTPFQSMVLYAAGPVANFVLAAVSFGAVGAGIVALLKRRYQSFA
jgi:membrane-associated protease RseP (regulator of RpoE activity)